MGYQGLTMDGRAYRVRIVYDTYAETFSLVEGPLAGDMESGRHERDLKGSASTYAMQIEPNPLYPEDWNDLWEALRAPVDSHSVTVIDQQGTLTYDAQIQSGGPRLYKGLLGGVKQYGGATIQFVPAKPQRRPTT